MILVFFRSSLSQRHLEECILVIFRSSPSQERLEECICVIFRSSLFQEDLQSDQKCFRAIEHVFVY